MFKELYSITPDFMNERERNKLIVDNTINNKFSIPAKSDLGRDIKTVARKVNKECDWYFNLDRIESIKISYMPPIKYHQPTTLLEEPVNNIGHQQKQRKLVCFVKLNDDSENVGGGGLIIKTKLGTQELGSMGDLVIIPTFVPFMFLNYGADANARLIYLMCIIRGLSFR
jgi:hypothetical protein